VNPISDWGLGISTERRYGEQHGKIVGFFEKQVHFIHRKKDKEKKSNKKNTTI